MGALTFDTHKAIQVLREGGLKLEEAEAVTSVIKQAQDAHVEQLATKADIAELKGEFRMVKMMLALVIAAQVLPMLKVFFA